MIQASELRVGNWIDFISKPNTPEQVTDIITHDVPSAIVNRVDITDIVGIPLTDEWLYRLGFGKYDNTFWVYDKLSTYQFEVDGRCRYHHIDWSDNSPNYDKDIDIDVNICIKYVHQLQNIYYILGIELK